MKIVTLILSTQPFLSFLYLIYEASKMKGNANEWF